VAFSKEGFMADNRKGVFGTWVLVNMFFMLSASFGLMAFKWLAVSMIVTAPPVVVTCLMRQPRHGFLMIWLEVFLGILYLDFRFFHVAWYVRTLECALIFGVLGIYTIPEDSYMFGMLFGEDKNVMQEIHGEERQSRRRRSRAYWSARSVR
jgi:hypothetical protein